MKYLRTPGELYTTTEFRALRSTLINQRTNAQGVLLCEYCGQPIVKKFDCIAHHMKEVSPQNMNDAAITLNPANIQLIHHACHDAIHKRFSGQLKGYQRKVYYVYGAPCSGKSTYVKENIAPGDLICDIDRIWECLSGQPSYIKPAELKPNVFALRDNLIEQIRTRAGKWGTAWVIEGGALAGERNRKIELLGAEDIFIDTDKKTCIQRLASDTARQCVREQWQQHIELWFNNYQA